MKAWKPREPGSALTPILLGKERDLHQGWESRSLAHGRGRPRTQSTELTGTDSPYPSSSGKHTWTTSLHTHAQLMALSSGLPLRHF